VIPLPGEMIKHRAHVVARKGPNLAVPALSSSCRRLVMSPAAAARVRRPRVAVAGSPAEASRCCSTAFDRPDRYGVRMQRRSARGSRRRSARSWQGIGRCLPRLPALVSAWTSGAKKASCRLGSEGFTGALDLARAPPATRSLLRPRESHSLPTRIPRGGPANIPPRWVSHVAAKSAGNGWRVP
jgi:hypothetical protein